MIGNIGSQLTIITQSCILVQGFMMESNSCASLLAKFDDVCLRGFDLQGCDNGWWGDHFNQT
jgi:hypothetical protein